MYLIKPVQRNLKKSNILYFIISSIIIFTTIYSKFLYNIYLHPIEMINSKGDLQQEKYEEYLSKYNYSMINKIGLNGFFELQKK